MVELGTKLRELRREQNWTQSQVAQRTGRTASVVSAYENGISGRRSPDSQYLISLDGLTPAKISLVLQLIDALKE